MALPPTTVSVTLPELQPRLETPAISVAAPVVNVAAPNVSVAPPVTNVAVAAPVVNVAPPTVNVAAPQVTLTPSFTVPQASVSVAAAAPVIQINPITMATVAPQPEARVAVAGAVAQFSPADHVHATVSSRTYHTLDASGNATVTYTKTFTQRPLFTFGVVASTGQQTHIEHVSDIIGTGAQLGLYVGCVIKGFRGQNLPSLTGITLLTGLTAALANFNPFGGSAAGVQVCVVAFPPS